MTTRFRVRDGITASASAKDSAPTCSAGESTYAYCAGLTLPPSELGHEPDTCKGWIGFDPHWPRHTATRLLRDDVGIERGVVGQADRRIAAMAPTTCAGAS